MQAASAAQLVAREILPWARASLARNAGRPVVIGVSGPQGSGKTTLCKSLVDIFSAEEVGLPAVAMSLDDFYLPHADLMRLAAAHPSNPLLHGRGLPGTHDLALLAHTLEAIHAAQLPVTVPVYDKAAYGGQGDRAAENKSIPRGTRVVFLEGWMLGFRALEGETEAERVQQLRNRVVPTDLVAEYGADNIAEVAGPALAAYATAVHDHLDHFVHWTLESPRDLPRVVVNWRTQQERELRAARGTGMSDADVERFVRRYLPLYALCVERLTTERVWASRDDPQGDHRRQLQVRLDEGRAVVQVERM
ncbi:P-loop containing nucleoside triphosphate hydrolase protein [Blastocladiella britannica]|nr:P-loop containing nucleoside triphosphate hydrolase protein [Blastocladiella britannica]